MPRLAFPCLALVFFLLLHVMCIWSFPRSWVLVAQKSVLLCVPELLCGYVLCASHAFLSHALPRVTMPRHATPRRAVPCHALPWLHTALEP